MRHLCLYLFIFWPNPVMRRILVPQPGTEASPMAVKAAVKVPSPNRWSARELPSLLLDILFYKKHQDF